MLENLEKKWNSRLLLVTLCAIAIGITVYHRHIHAQQKDLRLQNISLNYAESIKSAIQSPLSSVQFLSAYVRSQSGNLDGFSNIVGELLGLYGDAILFSVAPNGIIERVMPLFYTKELIGINLFTDELRANGAKIAWYSYSLSISGPLKLKDGQTIIIGEMPIIIEIPYEGRQRWGIASAIFRFPEILDSANLKDLENQNLAYRLTHTNPITGEDEVILSSNLEYANLDAGVYRSIVLPSSLWGLEIFPINDESDYTLVILEGVIALLVALLTFTWANTLSKSRREELLKSLAYSDPLTKLPNRTRLSEYFKLVTRDHPKDGSRIMVGFLDLDRFKQVNDRYGHKTGDMLLIEVVKRLQSHMRGGDILSRHGGDEFIFIWLGIKNSAECTKRLDAILELFSEPFNIDGAQISVGASIGVSFGDIGRDLDTLICEADNAMYEAKISGRGCYRFFNHPQERELSKGANSPSVR
ncbi:MAG: diguanylate cyclase domain-containing protein [Wolinella sp.]